MAQSATYADIEWNYKKNVLEVRQKSNDRRHIMTVTSKQVVKPNTRRIA